MCFLHDLKLVIGVFDSVKSLSKSGNPKKDQASSLPQAVKEPFSAPNLPVSAETEDNQESRFLDTSRRVLEKETPATYQFAPSDEKQPSSYSSNITFNGRDETSATAVGLEKERPDIKSTFRASTTQKSSYSVGSSQNSAVAEEKVQKVSPPRQKAYKDERVEKPVYGTRKESDSSDMSSNTYKPQNVNNSSSTSSGTKHYESEPPPDASINEILEVGFMFIFPINFDFRSVRNLFTSVAYASKYFFK